MDRLVIDICTTILIGIGSFYAYKSAVYAKNAWLHPVSRLDFEQISESTLEHIGSKYELVVDYKVINNSPIPAYIKEIRFHPKSNGGVVFGKISFRDIRMPPFTLKSGEEMMLNLTTSYDKKPKRIIITLVTPKRDFHLSIKYICDIPPTRLLLK
jgi:hypothetical protein